MSALELRDVRGPSALGGGWRRSLDLLLLIAVNEFRRSYLGTDASSLITQTQLSWVWERIDSI